MVIFLVSFSDNEENHCFGIDVNSDGDIFLTGHTLYSKLGYDIRLRLIIVANIFYRFSKGND